MAARVFFAAFRRLSDFWLAVLRVGVLPAFCEGREPRDLPDRNLLLRAFIWRCLWFGFPPYKRQFDVTGDHRKSVTQYPARLRFMARRCLLYNQGCLAHRGRDHVKCVA